MIQELCQHLRLINQKLENNLTAINDFKQLLLQSKSEVNKTQKEGETDTAVKDQESYFEIVLAKVATILSGFDEAKQSIKLVGSKNTQVKSMLEQLERDLNTLRSKSRRHQI